MQTSSRLMLGIAAIAVLFIGAFGAVVLTDRDNALPAYAQEPTWDRGVSVSGEGRISIVPDTARVTVGVQLDGEDLEELREDADERMNAVVDGLIEAGIPETDIRTVTYDISVRRDWEREGQPIVGYFLIQMVEVKITDLDLTGEIIDGALDNGANAVGNIWFEVEDRAEAIRQAREAAMADARDKAEHLAELGGVALGAPIRISESSPSLPPIFFEDVAMDEAADGDMAMSRVEPGESIITVNVSVVYAIE